MDVSQISPETLSTRTLQSLTGGNSRAIIYSHADTISAEIDSKLHAKHQVPSKKGGTSPDEGKTDNYYDYFANDLINVFFN